MTEKVSLREVVFNKLNELEVQFINQNHLDDKHKDTIKDQLAWMGKMWPILSQSDREWVQSARYAIEEQKPWT